MPQWTLNSPSGNGAFSFGSATAWDGTNLVVADEGGGYVVGYQFQNRFVVDYNVLRPFDHNEGNGYGRAVAVDGPDLNQVSISDTHLLVSTWVGAMFYEFTGSAWSLRSQIPGSNPSGFDFGFGVALSGPWAVVGAPEGAWVYRQTGTGWEHVGTLPNDQAADFRFSDPLSMRGAEVIFGQPDLNEVRMYNLDAAYTATGDLPELPTTNAVYPNPVRTVGTLMLRDPGVNRVRIVDMLGRSAGWARAGAGASWQIDASDLPPGTYFAVPESGGVHTAIPFLRH